MSQVGLSEYYGITASTLPSINALLEKTKKETDDSVVRNVVDELLSHEQLESREAMATALAITDEDVPDDHVLHFFASHARVGYINALSFICTKLPADSDVLPQLRHIEQTTRRLYGLARKAFGNENGNGNGNGKK